MKFKEFLLPYPRPYPDPDLFIKDMINGTLAIAMSSVLMQGQTLDYRI